MDTDAVIDLTQCALIFYEFRQMARASDQRDKQLETFDQARRWKRPQGQLRGDYRERNGDWPGMVATTTYTNIPIPRLSSGCRVIGSFPLASHGKLPNWPDGRGGAEMMLRYPVVIDGEKGAYGIVFPDLPGAFAMGATVDEALADAEEMLPSYVRVLEAKGQKVPPPSAVEDVELQPWEMVAFVALRYPTAVEG